MKLDEEFHIDFENVMVLGQLQKKGKQEAPIWKLIKSEFLAVYSTFGKVPPYC